MPEDRQPAVVLPSRSDLLARLRDRAPQEALPRSEAVGAPGFPAARGFERRPAARHTALPTRLPIPAVTAIASAPQKVTRVVARMTGAPPAFAPRAPSPARKTSEAPDTV